MNQVTLSTPSSCLRQATPDGFALFAKKMASAGLPSEVINLYWTLYGQLFVDCSDHLLAEPELEPVQPGHIVRHRELPRIKPAAGRDLLDHVVAIKINSDLDMGMRQAKSLIKVKDGLTFLDVILGQAASGQLGEPPLVLMNSSSTQDEILNVLGERRLSEEHKPLCFEHHMFPRVMADSLEPAERSGHPEQEWNSPGHGDLFASLFTTGVLDNLLNLGKRYAFVSRADNLAATVDTAILGYMAANRLTVLMEVTPGPGSVRDVGCLARLPSGQFTFGHPGQCLRGQSCQNLEQLPFISTNNLWIDLRDLKTHVQEYGLPRLPLQITSGPIDPGDDSSPRVLELTTALTGALNAFENTGVIEVGRDRFIQVTTTGDLLAIRSNCYVLGPGYDLRSRAHCPSPPISISLDDRYYREIDAFEARFPYGPPDLQECPSLEVVGDVLFSRDVKCRGPVRLVNRIPNQERVRPGTLLEGEVVWEVGQ